METIGKIRRRHKVKGESISAIARDLNLSRNTVKKYLNAEADPVYQRERQPAPKLGAHQSTLEAWLTQDSQRPKGQHRTARRLFEDLQREGYVGAYDSVQRFVKAWKTQRPGASQDAFVPLVYAAGDACQFDWSHEHVILGGVAQVVKLAHFRLAHSRQMFLAAYPRESQEMVFDAHNRAFALLRRGAGADDLRQPQNHRGCHLQRQGAPVQPQLPGARQPLPVRAGGLHPGFRMGEGPGREPSRQCARMAVYADLVTMACELALEQGAVCAPVILQSHAPITVPPPNLDRSPFPLH